MKTFSYADGDDIVVPVPESWTVQSIEKYLEYMHATLFLGAATVRGMVGLAMPMIVRRERAAA